MQFLGQTINPLGMGCWPIGGPMFAGDMSVGYTGSDDATSLRTIHAALDHGSTQTQPEEIPIPDAHVGYGAGSVNGLCHADRHATRPQRFDQLPDSLFHGFARSINYGFPAA